MNQITLTPELLYQPWYRNGNAVRIFLHLLLTCDEDGIVTTSRARLSTELKMSPQRVRSALKCLKDSQVITSTSTKAHTVIMVEDVTKFVTSDATKMQPTGPSLVEPLVRARIIPTPEPTAEPSLVSEEFLCRAVEIIRQDRRATVSHIQRKMKLGYTVASMIIDELELRGSIGPQVGAEPREILFDVDSTEPEEPKTDEPDPPPKPGKFVKGAKPLSRADKHDVAVGAAKIPVEYLMHAGFVPAFQAYTNHLKKRGQWLTAESVEELVDIVMEKTPAQATIFFASKVPKVVDNDGE